MSTAAWCPTTSPRILEKYTPLIPYERALSVIFWTWCRTPFPPEPNLVEIRIVGRPRGGPDHRSRFRTTAAAWTPEFLKRAVRPLYHHPHHPQGGPGHSHVQEWWRRLCQGAASKSKASVGVGTALHPSVSAEPISICRPMGESWSDTMLTLVQRRAGNVGISAGHTRVDGDTFEF